VKRRRCFGTGSRPDPRRRELLEEIAAAVKRGDREEALRLAAQGEEDGFIEPVGPTRQLDDAVRRASGRTVLSPEDLRLDALVERARREPSGKTDAGEGTDRKLRAPSVTFNDQIRAARLGVSAEDVARNREGLT
jgi:hypothetical protein